MLKKKKAKVETVAKIIHEYIAYSSISMYYSVIKLLSSQDPVEKSKAEDNINKMMCTAETLYENLAPKQKELLEKLALEMIKMCK